MKNIWTCFLFSSVLLPAIGLAQIRSKIDLSGKFIQIRFVGGYFQDDSQIIGVGNHFVRDCGANGPEEMARCYQEADTVFIVDHLDYRDDWCLTEVDSCEILPSMNEFLESMNEGSIDSYAIKGIAFCKVELNAVVREVRIWGPLLPDFNFEKPEKSALTAKERVICRIGCKGG